MAPLLNVSFTVVPTFYCQLNLLGPLKLYVSGLRKIQDCKVWIRILIRLVTKTVNLQVIGRKSADGVIDGVGRLDCKVGIPSIILTDQDSGTMKVFNKMEVNLVLLEENKIDLKLFQ